jgi:hypothetical protein
MEGNYRFVLGAMVAIGVCITGTLLYKKMAARMIVLKIDTSTLDQVDGKLIRNLFQMSCDCFASNSKK